MQSITFECEVITPMFLNGADGQTPELRAPSIKGALRFWWRAVNGHLGLEELKKQEGEIFGSTDKQSAFKIRLNKLSLSVTEEKALPHRERSHFAKAIRPHQVFEITFLCKTQKVKEIIKHLFPLCCVLGGLGNRSRRGFGSMKIVNGFYPNLLVDILKCLNTIVNEEEKKFIAIDNKISYRATLRQNYPHIETIEIGRADINLLERIGEATHVINEKHGFDYGKAIGSPSPRFASPVYVSAIETAKGLQSVVTTLHHPDGNKKTATIQEELKNEILN